MELLATVLTFLSSLPLPCPHPGDIDEPTTQIDQLPCNGARNVRRGRIGADARSVWITVPSLPFTGLR